MAVEKPTVGKTTVEKATVGGISYRRSFTVAFLPSPFLPSSHWSTHVDLTSYVTRYTSSLIKRP